MNVKNLAAIVTGGGTGIGFATAKLLKEEGAKVTILGRRQDVIEKTGQEIGAGHLSKIGMRRFDVQHER